jgi:hypothetical protein
MEEPEERDSLAERREQEMRPVREAGGGEAEGFEETERELIEHASHGDSGPDPSQLAGDPEECSGAEYGEADHEQSAETPGEDR